MSIVYPPKRVSFISLNQFISMKKLIVTSLFALSVVGFYGCQPSEQAVEADDTATSIFTAARLGTSPADSSTCRMPLTKIDVSTLPAAVTSYINTNYAGATIKEAGKDSQGAFIVRIESGNTRKTLAFNADGSFKAELTHRRDRSFRGLTQVEPASLPSAITSYISSTYAGAEIKMAGQDASKAYLVLIQVNGQPKMLQFNADGSFNQELTRPERGKGRGKGGPGKNGNWQDLALTDLPKSVTDYVAANYAGAQVKKAAKDATDGRFIVWVQAADGKHVMLLFNADGSFLEAITRK